ncbi:conjugal transfer protein [Kitasatospora sp. NPDC085895]|uniref:conjugal transfer protein n=1 Tax=Kitasatospora sp. NPDC085895 TaxID=3155057 RepID=UPI0034503EEC
MGDGRVVEAGGWSVGGRANAVAAVRWAAWGLLVLGPVLGGAAFVSASSAAAPVRPVPAAAPASGGQGAAGFAQLFVAAFIGAGDGDQAELAAYFPGASALHFEGTPGQRRGEQLTVVRLRQTDRDVWSVTVAARIVDRSAPSASPSADSGPGRQGSQPGAAGAVRYFQVPVATAAAADGSSGFVALAMPAEVSAPARIDAPALVYGSVRPALPSDPLVQAVGSFLAAYLTGSGAPLDRFLAPGTRIGPVLPAPYTAVAVDQVAVEGSDVAGAVPRDGVRVRLLAVVRATGPDGARVPLSYAFTLSARAGRWEIAALEGAPAEADGSVPAPGQSSPVGPSTAAPH